jgi:hypothetical protein
VIPVDDVLRHRIDAPCGALEARCGSLPERARAFVAGTRFNPQTTQKNRLKSRILMLFAYEERIFTVA